MRVARGVEPIQMYAEYIKKRAPLSFRVEAKGIYCQRIKLVCKKLGSGEEDSVIVRAGQ